MKSEKKQLFLKVVSFFYIPRPKFMIKYKVVEKRKGTAMLTREEIRKMTQEATYKKGLQLYYSKNRITDFNE